MAQERTPAGAAPDQSAAAVPAPAQPVLVLPPKRTFWQNIVFFVTRKPLGTFGAAVAVSLVLMAVFAPVIAMYNPYTVISSCVTDEGPRCKWAPPGTQSADPEGTMIFGADHLSRDVFSRLIYGARISLYVGIVASFVGCTIGMMVGVISVHFGGATDLTVQRFIDALISFPTLILAIAIMAALGASLLNVIIALSIVYIPSTARIMRSQFMAIKEMDYILASQAVGAGNWRIMIKHMIPNCFALYLVIFTFHLGGAIIAEASLSFLGVGTPIDVPSWGGMLSQASSANVTVAPSLAIFPGLAIAVVVFSWNVLGDAIRDVMDPKLRGTT